MFLHNQCSTNGHKQSYSNFKGYSRRWYSKYTYHYRFNRTDLQVDAGSSIIFDVATAATDDAMVINLATGATAGIAGTISFNAQPGGTRAHRLLAQDAMAITVNSGGIIKAMGLTGNPFGNSLPLNTVVLQCRIGL